jgi:hypothetical protein
MDGDGHFIAVPGERLVDRVVDDLVHEMVKSSGSGRPDVHPGTLAYRFESLQDGDVLGVITCLSLRALRSAVSVRQRSSEYIETPRIRDGGAAAGASKLVF